MHGSIFGFHEPGFKFAVTGNSGINAGMESWRIWVAILLLVDAGIGLLGLSRLERIIPAPTLTRIAIAEALAALALVAWHFARA